MDKKAYILKQCNRYWAKGTEYLEQLPIPTVEDYTYNCPPEIVIIKLPEWASEYGEIAVPIEALLNTKADYQSVDWYFVCDWYLNCRAERKWELENGSVHSYSYRLSGWNPIVWEKAWVNRICLFLRKYASIYFEKDALEIFGPIPEYSFLMTHDIDAIKKTCAIRFKQTLFQWFNAYRLLRQGIWRHGFKKIKSGLRFLFSRESYWQSFLDLLRILEDKKIKSIFHFYSKIPQQRKFSSYLYDPSYQLNYQLTKKIKALNNKGHKIGIHPSFHAFDDAENFAKQLSVLKENLKFPILYCRQHWLRFSFSKTWKIQESLGIQYDTTLGFNDRIGFRNGSALETRPWEGNGSSALSLSAMPMLFMDSQFYDYNLYDENKMKSEMKIWLDEVRFVKGEISLLWHSHTIGKDYGWKNGLINLLEEIS